MGREGWVRVGGAAAVLGGLAWIVKGGMILAVGIQPPLLFELAPALLALGLVALSLRLEARGNMRRAGAALAGLALMAAVVGLVAPAPEDDFSPALLVSFLALIVGPVLLGVVARRESVFGPGRVSSLPLLLGLGTIPAIMVGGGLEALHERLLEVPLVLLGVLWGWVGIELLSTVAIRRSTAEPAGG